MATENMNGRARSQDLAKSQAGGHSASAVSALKETWPWQQPWQGHGVGTTLLERARDAAAAVAVAPPLPRFLRGTWLDVCRSVSNDRTFRGSRRIPKWPAT
jgi:hypothetical protein